MRIQGVRSTRFLQPTWTTRQNPCWFGFDVLVATGFRFAAQKSAVSRRFRILLCAME